MWYVRVVTQVEPKSGEKNGESISSYLFMYYALDFIKLWQVTFESKHFIHHQERKKQRVREEEKGRKEEGKKEGIRKEAIKNIKISSLELCHDMTSCSFILVMPQTTLDGLFCSEK